MAATTHHFSDTTTIVFNVRYAFDTTFRIRAATPQELLFECDADPLSPLAHSLPQQDVSELEELLPEDTDHADDISEFTDYPDSLQEHQVKVELQDSAKETEMLTTGTFTITVGTPTDMEAAVNKCSTKPEGQEKDDPENQDNETLQYPKA